MSRKRVYTPEEIRERKRLRCKEYRKRNRDAINARRRAKRQTPEGRERRKAENRKWREKNPDYMRGYYAKHREAFREYRLRYWERWGKKHGIRVALTEEERIGRQRSARRKWYEKNREKANAQTAAWRKRNRDKVNAWRKRRRDAINAYARAYYKAHPEYGELKRMRRVAREMVDAEYYANNRRKARERADRKRRREGKPVRRPRLCMRIPDWCCRGGGAGRAIAVALGERHGRAEGVCAGAVHRTP